MQNPGDDHAHRWACLQLIMSGAQLERGCYMSWADRTVFAAAGIGAPTQTLDLIRVTASQVRQQVVDVPHESAGAELSSRPVGQGT